MTFELSPDEAARADEIIAEDERLWAAGAISATPTPGRQRVPRAPVLTEREQRIVDMLRGGPVSATEVIERLSAAVEHHDVETARKLTDQMISRFTAIREQLVEHP